jgi:hypothetical protein
MSTNQTIPTILEPSAEIDYAIVCWVPDGDEGQREDLTFEEYGALRRHLAKLRGLIPGEEPTAAQPNVTAETAPSEPTREVPEPQTKTAKMAADTLDYCIGEIESKRDVMLQIQEARPDIVLRTMGDAFLLKRILSDWGSGGFDAEFPNETELLRSLRGNLEL